MEYVDGRRSGQLMHKVKVKMTIECEMELNPEYYDEGSSFQDMVNAEIENMKGDPNFYFDIIQELGGIPDLEINEDK
jgi:hypothetical protein